MKQAIRKNVQLSAEAFECAAECLKTIAHPHRLRMIRLLLKGEYTVGELAEACGIQSHVASEHLGKMKDRSLLISEKRGRATYYTVADDGLESIMICIEKRFG